MLSDLLTLTNLNVLKWNLDVLNSVNSPPALGSITILFLHVCMCLVCKNTGFRYTYVYMPTGAGVSIVCIYTYICTKEIKGNNADHQYQCELYCLNKYHIFNGQGCMLTAFKMSSEI